MNDLNLRVSGGIGVKVKKPVAPINMKYWNDTRQNTGNENDEFYKKFLDSNSADDQLKLMKRFLNNRKDLPVEGSSQEQLVEFLVLLFWDADAKHPVKGFLKKHITESRTLRQPFIKLLASVIADDVELLDYSIEEYAKTVTRLDACIDKFPPGATAVSDVEIKVATFLLDCLQYCIATLNVAGGKVNNTHFQIKSEPLAPTEINKIYDLVHLTLRLLLYMIQKVKDENRSKLSSMFEAIRSINTELMSGKEVPMDTKSVCGIIDLTIHMFKNGPDSWIELLKNSGNEQSGTTELCLYSAMATIVPTQQLIAAGVNDLPAIVDLTHKILDIGDTYSSEPSHILAVARTLLAASRALERGGRDALLVRPLLAFCWAHADHHMDSVRHLAAQVMGLVVKACVRMEREGDATALELVFSGLSAVDCSRKSYYVALSALGAALGGGLLARRAGLVRDVVGALGLQHVQACATTLLETLLKRHMQEAPAEVIYNQWIAVILERVKSESDPTVLTILEQILGKAVQWDSDILHYILPEQRAISSYVGSDLKCILLVLGVVRKSGVAYKGFTYEDLMHTAYDADDEIRVLSLSLVAATPRSTELFSADELRFVLHFLEHNVNAQAPSFRQLVLALLKKILKRVEDSFKVLKRNAEEHASEISFYLQFLEDLRTLCFNSLMPGANYGRRCSVLQILAWEDSLQLEGYVRGWSKERVYTLHDALDDSYENNKALALEVLVKCPKDLYFDMIENGYPSYFESVITQASCLKPTECVSASYKLLLMIAHTENSAPTEPPLKARLFVLQRLLRDLKSHAERASDVTRACRDAPMYGLVHCAAKVIGSLDAQAVAGNPTWSELIGEYVSTCVRVNSLVGCVVNAASPEGLLPDQPADGSEGPPVTAQMVLLCAWRSVKETSLFLGGAVSRLCVEGEQGAWTLSAGAVEHVGEHLMELLARVKHRGAFEQAYVGFTLLLARLWRCSSPRLHQLPLQWFDSVERELLTPALPAADCAASRRGAGLPFMIQALVTTELAAESSAPRGRLLARCVSLCLRVARAGPSAGHAARAHLVLRALCRHAAPPAQAIADAIEVAVRGFAADTWMERNSSTLLFAALCVRVFGVARARTRLSARNKMTGRIFFLNYPQLYDFMLDQLKSVPDESLRPSLFPTLLLLARLYPSALEGTVSNLKLERFLSPLRSLAGAGDVGSRRLAARAAVSLVAPHRFIPHLESLFGDLADRNIKKNLCHGILCQISALLESPPADLHADYESTRELTPAVRKALWLLDPQPAPCYLVADQFLHALNLLLLRFPGIFYNDLIPVAANLEHYLFDSETPKITSGREVFLANAVYINILIFTITYNEEGIIKLTMKCLTHPDYEVKLSALNYLLMLHDQNEELCDYLNHLSQITDKNIIYKFQDNVNYVQSLCDITKITYLECVQKALKVLTLTPNTQKEIVKLKLNTNEEPSFETTVLELLDSVENGHENLSSIYLESVLKLVSKSRNVSGIIIAVARALYTNCSAENDESARAAVVTFLESNLLRLLCLVPANDEALMFELKATVVGAAAILLEDDAPALRRRAAAAVQLALTCLRSEECSQAVEAGRAAQELRRFARRAGDAALLVTLASLDMRARHHEPPDEGEGQGRVFDQSETHNVYLEEFPWTIDCAVKLKEIHKENQNNGHITQTIDEFVASIVLDHRYRGTIERLCIDNAVQCLTKQAKSDNPKIDLFFKILNQ